MKKPAAAYTATQKQKERLARAVFHYADGDRTCLRTTAEQEELEVAFSDIFNLTDTRRAALNEMYQSRAAKKAGRNAVLNVLPGETVVEAIRRSEKEWTKNCRKLEKALQAAPRKAVAR